MVSPAPLIVSRTDRLLCRRLRAAAVNRRCTVVLPPLTRALPVATVLPSTRAVSVTFAALTPVRRSVSPRASAVFRRGHAAATRWTLPLPAAGAVPAADPAGAGGAIDLLAVRRDRVGRVGGDVIGAGAAGHGVDLAVADVDRVVAVGQLAPQRPAVAGGRVGVDDVASGSAVIVSSP